MTSLHNRNQEAVCEQPPRTAQPISYRNLNLTALLRCMHRLDSNMEGSTKPAYSP
jgi:hypothetical protein